MKGGTRVALKLPVDVRALYDAGKRLKEDREKPIRLAVLVEVDAPDALVDATKECLRPKTANAMVDVAAVEPGFTMKVGSQADAALVLVGSGSHVAPTLHALRERGMPTLVVAVREEKGAFARLVAHPENDVAVGTDPTELLRGPVADWMMDRIAGKRSALAHNFEFMRRAVAKDIVKSTAWQNAAIGVVVFVPGADMPLMTLNQGKMLLQIAAAYGQPLDSERIKELAAVVGGGFLFRTFARELVAFVPGLGWAVKGGIAYTGTMAMGLAAIQYFEQGVDLSGVIAALTSKAGEAAHWAGSRLHRGESSAIEIQLDDITPGMGPGEVHDPGSSRHTPGYTAAAAGSQPALLDVPPARPTLVPPRAEEPPVSATPLPEDDDGVGAGSLP